MGTALEPAKSLDANTMEIVVAQGDLTALSPAQRVAYYANVCQSLGLNPLTRPFEYLKLNGKLVLYARKDATEQLRVLQGVSITKLTVIENDGVYSVVAEARDKDGRTDSAIGSVAVDGLRGEAKANAMMKAETKAKRRVTLSLVGLGWMDESEVGSIPDAQRVDVDTTTGEIKGGPAKPLHEQFRDVTNELGWDDQQRRELLASLFENRSWAQLSAKEQQQAVTRVRAMRPAVVA